jgi:Polyketide cyclase / dehydrase and lipid transport
MERLRQQRLADAHVFALLTDLEQYLAQWAKGPVAARKLTTGPTSAGSRFEVTARVAGIRVRLPYVVTNCELDRRIGGDGIAGLVRFSEEYALELDPDGSDCTRLRDAMLAEPRGVFRLARGRIAGQLRRLLDADLERFKALVENTPPRSGS